MVSPCCHTPTNTAEGDIGRGIDKKNHGIVPFEVDAHIETGCEYREALEAVVASESEGWGCASVEDANRFKMEKGILWRT